MHRPHHSFRVKKSKVTYSEGLISRAKSTEICIAACAHVRHRTTTTTIIILNNTCMYSLMYLYNVYCTYT